MLDPPCAELFHDVCSTWKDATTRTTVSKKVGRYAARPGPSIFQSRPIEQALRDVWQVLKAHDPDHDWDKDSKFQQGLASTLMDLADAGVTDAQELRNMALATLDLKRSH
jgi:hypothetical protein